MRRKRTALLACLCLALVPRLAVAQPTRVASHAGINEYRLANGLRVVIVPDDGSQSLSVAVVYLTGARDEGAGQFGITHLMEHVMFTGTTTHPGLLAEFGRRGASSNATTDHDRTLFYETLPWSEENLAWALSMEADRMANIQITAATVEKERAAVKQEMASVGGDPRRILFETVHATAYGWHGYGRSPVGTQSDVAAITPASLQQFYRRHYRPSNAVLLLGGPFDQAKALALVQAEFGGLPAGSSDAVGMVTVEPPQPGERRLVVRGAGASPLANIAFHVPPTSHPGRPAIHVLAEILAGPRGLVGGSYELLRTRDAGLLMFTRSLGTDDPLKAVDDLEQKIEQAIAKPPSAAVVDEARQRVLAALAAADRSTTRLVHELAEWIAAGDWRLRYLYRDRLQKVDAQTVAGALAYLRRENRTTGILLPQTTDRAAIAIPPSPNLGEALKTYSETTATTVPAGEDAVTTGALQNGLRYALRVRPRPDGSATAHLFLHFGSAPTLRGLRAVGDVTGRALMNGVRSGATADRLAPLGVKVTGSGSAYALFIAFDGAGARLPEAVKIVTDALRRPTLDAAAVDRARQDLLTAAADRGADMSQETVRVLAQSLAGWPQDHVLYVGTKDETTAALRAVQTEDVAAFHKRFYGASAGEFVVAGTLDAPVFIKTLEQTLGTWQNETPFERVAPPSTFGAPGVTQLPPLGGTGAFVLAGIGIPIHDDHADYPALLVANQLLGGGFYGALLPTRIRGEAGAAYRVASIVHANAWGDETRRFEITVMCAAKDVPVVTDLIREVLFEAPQASDDAIVAAREGLVQSQRLAATRETRWIGDTAHQLHRGRSASDPLALEEKLKRVSPDDVRRVLKQYLNPEKLLFVVTG